MDELRCCNGGTELEVSVILPLCDFRLDERECLMSWLEPQTVARQRYEVVVISDGSNPQMDAALKKILRPHDQFLTEPGANMMALYDVGARHARSPLLLLTEAHCVAKPNFLEEMLGFMARHDFDGACCHSDPGCLTKFARVEAQVFEGYFAQWSRPGDWRKVMLRGFAIWRDVYLAAGGFDTRYSRFADWILAARLRAQGRRLGYCPTANMVHYYSTSFGMFYEIVCEHAKQEYDYQCRHPGETWQGYLAAPAQWADRESFRPAIARRACTALARCLARSLFRNQKGLWALAAEFCRYLPRALGRLVVPRVLAWAAVWPSRVQFWFRKDEGRLCAVYEKAYRRIERYAMLGFIARVLAAEQPPPVNSRYVPGQMPDDQFAGFHQPERWQDRPFRWTRTVGVCRVNLPHGDYDFTLELLPLRADFEAALRGVFFNGHAIPLTFLSPDGCHIRGRITAEMFVAGPEQHLLCACIPQPMSALAAADSRPLGLPVSALHFEAVAQSEAPEVHHQAA